MDPSIERLIESHLREISAEILQFCGMQDTATNILAGKGNETFMGQKVEPVIERKKKALYGLFTLFEQGQ